ncbi:MAG TPA: hypothetical protein VMV77_07265 [Bacteroidales bacterium]|nr:hypothetical protein [Bacteroidales bacterium]
MTTLGLFPDRKRVYQLMQIYDDSAKVMQDIIFSIDAGNYSDVQANKIRRDIKLEVQKLNLRSMQWSKVAIPEAYNQSKKFNGEIYSEYKVKQNPNYNTDTHQKTIDKAINETENILIKANLSIIPQVNIYLKLIKDASGLLVRADLQELGTMDAEMINEIVMEGLGEQMTLKKISGEVERYLRMKLKVGDLININGKNYNMKKYSKMVARTQMRITQSVATRNLAKQFNNDLVAWSKHVQAEPDDLCVPYAGNVYSWSGNSTKYAKIPAIPPTHPNCEHYLNAVPEILVEMEPERFPNTFNQKARVIA